MSLEYSGAHSINFFRTIHGTTRKRNSWLDYHLVPSERPKISVRQPNFLMVALPGTSKRVDITDFHNGGLTYGERTGSWTFYVDHEQWPDWKTAYDQVCEFLHGQRVYVSLEDEPTLYYMGVLTVADPKPGKAYSEITIQYNLSLDTVVQGDMLTEYFPIRFIGESGLPYANDYGIRAGAPTYIIPAEEGETLVTVYDLSVLNQSSGGE